MVIVVKACSCVHYDENTDVMYRASNGVLGTANLNREMSKIMIRVFSVASTGA